MPKQVICYLSQDVDNISIEVYSFEVKKKNFFQELFIKNKNANYIIEDTFSFHFPFHKNTKLEEVIKYGQMVNEKLIASGYEGTSMDLILNIKGMFKGKITLPKLSGKSLADSYNYEFDRLYGNLTEKFTCISNQSINEQKGYDFELLFIHNDQYRILTSIFTINKIKLDHIYHTPSVFSSMFNKGNLTNLCCLGIMMEQNQTRMFLSIKGEIVDYRIVKVGVNDIDKLLAEKLEIAYENIKTYRHENRRKTVIKQVISRGMKKISDEIFAIIASNREIKALDKIIVNSNDGYTEDLLSPFARTFKGVVDIYSSNRDVQQNLLVDVFLGSTKHFLELPQKVKK